MPIYDTQNMTPVDDFEHRGTHVYIYKTSRGARHCGVDHDPNEKTCKGCKKPIVSRPVFVSVMRGMIFFESIDQADVTEQTKLYLDDKNPVDSSDRLEDKDWGEEVPDESEPTKPPDNRPRKKGGLKSTEEQMARLGWSAWLKDLVRQHDKEDRKSRGSNRK